jgi:hypothetical protein
LNLVDTVHEVSKNLLRERLAGEFYIKPFLKRTRSESPVPSYVNSRDVAAASQLLYGLLVQAEQFGHLHIVKQRFERMCPLRKDRLVAVKRLAGIP